MLLMPYEGQLWINIVFWASLATLALSYIADLIIGLKLLRSFSKSASNLLLAIIFVVNLTFPVALYLFYSRIGTPL